MLIILNDFYPYYIVKTWLHLIFTNPSMKIAVDDKCTIKIFIGRSGVVVAIGRSGGQGGA